MSRRNPLRKRSNEDLLAWLSELIAAGTRASKVLARVLEMELARRERGGLQ